MRLRALAASLVLILASSPADAGIFKVVVASTDGDAKPSDVTLEGDDLNLQAAGADTFHFSLPAGQASALLTVSADGPPDGSADFTMQMLVPYFWDNTVQRLVGAAVTPKSIITPRQYALLRTGDGLLTGSLAEQVLLNQETRLIFRKFRTLGRAPTGEEIKLISFFVISSKELVLNNGVVVDDDMLNAMAVLEQATTDQAADFENVAALQSAETAMEDLRGSEYAQWLAMVNHLNRDAAATRDNGYPCQAAEAVQASLDDRASDNQKFDESHKLRLINATTIARCIAPALQADTDATPEQQESALELGASIHQSIDEGLPIYRASSGLTGDDEDTLSRNAFRRSIEIGELLDYHDAL